MTSVILSGAGGFVGSHVLQQLLERTEYQVIAIDSFRHNGQSPNLVEVMRKHPDRVEVWIHDLRAPFSPSQKEDARFARSIINIASRCSVDQSIRDPEPFVLNNIHSMLTMLELARWVRPRLFMHLSTDEVHGPGDQDWHVHAPSSPYAASKAAQEDLAEAYSSTYQIPTTVISASNMFGERQSYLAFIPRVIRACLLGKELVLHKTPSGYGKRNYLYASNMAEGLVRLEQTSTHLGYQKTLARGQRVVHNREMVDLVCRVAGTELPKIKEVEASTIRPAYDIHYDLTTDDNYDIPFDTALHRTTEWYRERV